MSFDIAQQLSVDFSFQLWQVQNTLALFDEGATVPFISRYRKERTGSLDEIQVRDLLHKYTYYKELEERRQTILQSIKEQGKLTPELEKRINSTLNKTELEDLYLPFKPKRATRASKAKEAGLEPLARFLVDLESSTVSITDEATKYLNPEKDIDTPEKAIQGASDILAEEISDNADTRKWMRDLAHDQGKIFSEIKKEFEGQKTKYDMYNKFNENVKSLPSHRILALLRGEREKFLRVWLELPRESAIGYLNRQLIKHPQSAAAEILKNAVIDSFDRLLLPATETEVRKDLREFAEAEAIKVFTENLEALLLAPPAGRKYVIGIDPGFRTGCKIVVVDDTGKFIENFTIYPHEPQRDIDGSRVILLALIARFNVGLIAIGNGTASRETLEFVRKAMEDVPEEKKPISVVVNEAGASVYSASDLAIKEFPDLDITVRGAISIARRLQDPLSELVKIDPKSIGVGQYQHDVNQTKLRESLEEIVESCVNRVGVDINLASEELLKYVSGLNKLIAANIVLFRNEKGAFHSRDEILKVPGMGEKKFQLSAGFLRISGADNPLDNSAVHPERYTLVQSMAEKLSTNLHNLIGNSSLIHSLNKNDFVNDEVGLPTIEDILKELEKPGRDPREEFRYATFSESVTDITDLKNEMILEGTVSNVTKFGAFVDIGVHVDGLVHISELSNTFVSDPMKAVKVGQVVKVRIISVDQDLKRISLSMKLEPSQPVQRERPREKKPFQRKEFHPRGERPRKQGQVESSEQKRTDQKQDQRKNFTPPRPPMQKFNAKDLAEKFKHPEKQQDQKSKLKTNKPKFNIRQIMP